MDKYIKELYIKSLFDKHFKDESVLVTNELIDTVGKGIHENLLQDMRNIVSNIHEEECIDYAYNLVLSRTYEGYRSEIDTVYGQLQSILSITIEPAPDEWDRTYNVDFRINVNNKYIGLQIKPIASGQALNQYQWIEMHRVNHQRFENEFSGKVFFIYSVKSSGKKKKIYNTEVIEDITNEISRLQNL